MTTATLHEQQGNIDLAYNHFEFGQPILIEYIWGRRIGENTINP
jgi:hypothetical protein